MLKFLQRHQWSLLVAILVGFLFLEYAVRTPWALHIGGRSTLDEQWDGFGQVQSDRGGRYLLYVHLQGGMLGTSPTLRAPAVGLAHRTTCMAMRSFVPSRARPTCSILPASST